MERTTIGRKIVSFRLLTDFIYKLTAHINGCITASGPVIWRRVVHICGVDLHNNYAFVVTCTVYEYNIVRKTF